MIEVEFSRKSLDNWEKGTSKLLRKELDTESGIIVAFWLAEMQRQINTWNDREWPVLTPKYADRKWHDFLQHHRDSKGTYHHPRGNVVHNSMLMRTGQMIEGYAAGIQTFSTRTNLGVEMPYPVGNDSFTGKPLLIRAAAHQGDAKHTPGNNVRAFDEEKLEEIAIIHYAEAMNRAVLKANKG